MAELAFLRALAMAEISPAARRVGAFLISRYNAKRSGAWPEFGTIARYCGLNERTVIRATKELEAAGCLCSIASMRPLSTRRCNE